MQDAWDLGMTHAIEFVKVIAQIKNLLKPHYLDAPFRVYGMIQWKEDIVFLLKDKPLKQMI